MPDLVRNASKDDGKPDDQQHKTAIEIGRDMDNDVRLLIVSRLSKLAAEPPSFMED